MPHLFEPLKLRDITFRNRIGISPMCQYSSVDGFANDWHLVHLGSRAVGGAGMVMVEATAVEPRGRISPDDMGIWSDDHVEPLARIARFIKQHGAVPAIQLAHAGRKASTSAPWKGHKVLSPSEGGWQPVGPSVAPFEGLAVPSALAGPEQSRGAASQIKEVQQHFVAATRRALDAGFELIELHGAHGYLAHSFYSPLSNFRTDEYGRSFDNRTRFITETAAAMRKTIPDRLPFFVRLSCSDWVEGGWTIDDSVKLSGRLKELGTDLIDCSSGGNVNVKIPVGPGYQVPFAERIRRDAAVATAAVGLITEAGQADEIVRSGKADMVLIARASLRDSYFPVHAAIELGHRENLPLSQQYRRAF
ncbi:MAG: NADH:flavin oxidoreductase/NADH oxidase [Anaerolineae bacterium]|nr:NADH:flavin oxidoreductase/NADH oxidase [Phycisphaerae bacterium]